MLRARVTAPPVRGQANAALERLIAKSLGVPKTAVAVVAGAQSREKTLAVGNMATEDAVERLRDATGR